MLIVRRIFSSVLPWLGISVLVVVLIYRLWFFEFGILTWGDWGFVFEETGQQWLSIPQTWDNSGLGNVFVGLPLYLPARLFWSLFSQFLTFPYVERIIFLFPSVLVGAISSFLLVYQITKNKLAALVASFVYNFNTHILILNTGHLTLSTAFAIAPLVFLFFQKALEKKSLKFAIATGLTGFLVSAYEVRGFYLLSIILFLYFLYQVFLSKIYKNLGEFLVISFYAGLPFGLILLLNLYWLLPFFVTLQAFESIVLGQQLVNVDAFFFPRNLLLFNPTWTDTEQLAWGRVQPVPARMWFIPFLAFFGFWFSRKNRQIIFWAIVALVGIFFLKMTNQPFGSSYVWLFEHFPLFNAFREPSKFMFLVILGFSVLIGSFINWLLSQKFNRYFKIVLVVFVAGLFLYNGRLVFSGQLGKLLTPRQIPRDYQILKEFIRQQPEFFRTLYFPHDSRWGYWDSLHPKMSARLLVQNEWRKLNDYQKTGLDYSEFDEVTNIFKKPFANNLLDYASVKYVIVPLEDKENEEAFIFPKNVTPQAYINFLSTLPFVERIDIGTSDLAVFENKSYFPHIYSQSIEVNVIGVSPTKYEVRIGNMKAASNITINFSENYHPGWKAKIGQLSWFDELFPINNFSINSGPTEFNLNSFTLPQASSGEKITIYFAPQSLANLGLVVGLVTLVSSLCILTFLCCSKR